MARRKRRGGRKGSKAIAILPVAALSIPAFEAYSGCGGDLKTLPKWLLYTYTGTREAGGWDSVRATRNIGLLIGAVVGHKVANKMGLNKYIKKATFGYLQL